MVGKVNVGKSQLFHDVFPKGRKTLDKRLGTILPARAGIKLDESKDVALEMEETSIESIEEGETGNLITSDISDFTPVQP